MSALAEQLAPLHLAIARARRAGAFTRAVGVALRDPRLVAVGDRAILIASRVETEARSPDGPTLGAVADLDAVAREATDAALAAEQSTSYERSSP